MSKRAKKREENLKIYDDFERIISHEALFAAAQEAAKGVNWKASVQRFKLNACLCVDNLHKELARGKDVRKGFIEFDIVERGNTLLPDRNWQSNQKTLPQIYHDREKKAQKAGQTRQAGSYDA